jgi:hypothetical protein
MWRRFGRTSSIPCEGRYLFLDDGECGSGETSEHICWMTWCPVPQDSDFDLGITRSCIHVIKYTETCLKRNPYITGTCLLRKGSTVSKFWYPDDPNIKKLYKIELSYTQKSVGLLQFRFWQLWLEFPLRLKHKAKKAWPWRENSRNSKYEYYMLINTQLEALLTLHAHTATKSAYILHTGHLTCSRNFLDFGGDKILQKKKCSPLTRNESRSPVI